MKELVIISGKGGTGKTSIAASFAFLARDKVIADCDVDAANLHLVTGPETAESGEFAGGKKAVIDPALCTGCGKCVPACRFDAIGDSFIVDELACEGCGVCAYICPEGAVFMAPHIAGRWFVSSTPHGTMVHARLGIAEGNSGKLVSFIRNRAREIARRDGLDLVIVDGPPGTGCPVIASITGSRFVLIVTEPTVAGLHDMDRALELVRHFRVKAGVCVNRADISPETTEAVRAFCIERGIPLLAEIPHDPDVTRAQVAGKSTVEFSGGPAAAAIRNLWKEVSHELS